MTTELRVLQPDEGDAWYGKLERAFGEEESAEERAMWRELMEPGRSLAAWDDDEIVGTAGAFSFGLTVPGGASVPAAGVTMVSVQPTHRRRGVLRAMMRRQLDDVRERGEPLAMLTASEPAIYGRFGYGAATQEMRIKVDTTRVAEPDLPGSDDVRLRLKEPAEALAACEAVYARTVAGRAGMLVRPPGWDRMMILDPEDDRDDDEGPLQCVVAEAGGEVCGYARYAVVADWSDAGPQGTVRVWDLTATDPVVGAALWRYLFGIDLTTYVTARNLPVDDPLLHLVEDMRRCLIGLREAAFVRPVELGAALAARTYQRPVDTVLEVADPFCPWNEGRWRLSGDGTGATCERTTDPAELALSVRELSSAYLGGFTLSALAGAGRVRELRPGALAAASVAFGTDVAPWLPHEF
ncbi:GNAT family N-acetyltransferase [Streptomyces benahoarensis]|uniref:GNAT family N-acetyltransferase n=1 Tax=Streptomyces benahoarensis TaxID=2595054 RepID=A0A553ZPS8_9ACTN|nr:GNAT family N-acetyltransferase [Streptomyces benahoarensis]TSB30459.1 GNAT family N-acetyltransferase [Streptomyces benahoarensis]TSB43478.1 GNAT family N-acetyltransferase [Streptomyces benahoarensis]